MSEFAYYVSCGGRPISETGEGSSVNGRWSVEYLIVSFAFLDGAQDAIQQSKNVFLADLHSLSEEWRFPINQLQAFMLLFSTKAMTASLGSSTGFEKRYNPKSNVSTYPLSE